MIMMRESLDVYHDESHVFRILNYLDGFMSTEEYKKISPYIDMRSLFMAILWHDTWKASREPKSILGVIPDIIIEGIACSRKFQKAAEAVGLDDDFIQKVKYIIRKHALIQVLPIMTIEAKILSDMDDLDAFSLNRLYLLEKKYSCDRPFDRSTWYLAKFGINIIKKKKTEKNFFLDWAKKELSNKKDIFLKKAQAGIDAYEEALLFLEKGSKLEFERYRIEWVARNITRPELLEKPDDPF